MLNNNIKILLLTYKGISYEQYQKIYLEPITTLFQNKANLDLAFLPLPPINSKKISANDMKAWFKQNQENLNSYSYIFIADANWFKVITKQKKATGSLGVVTESPYCKAKVLYIPSYKQWEYGAYDASNNLKIVITRLHEYVTGTYKELGTGIVHSEAYPMTVQDIKSTLDSLLTKSEIDVDIETKGLKVTEAGIYTICITWDRHNGVAFPVDAIPTQSKAVRQLLKEFFLNYKGIKNVHKANFDISVLTYVLFMEEDLTNTKGMLQGLNCLLNNLDDTLLVTYLATNSCAGNKLGLKELAIQYAGDWAVDVTDVTKVNLNDLLKYNLIDGLCTRYVKETYYPKMVEDQQLDLYKTFMLPTLKTNIRIQLAGLPIDINEVIKFKETLETEANTLKEILQNSKVIQDTEYLLSKKATELRNSKLKTKVTSIEDNWVTFNNQSNNHLKVLLYEVMKLPIIERTKTKEPATGKDIINQLINHTNNEEFKTILSSISSLADSNKILTAFIPAFLNSAKLPDGSNRLLGYMNLGGTVSGRLSSSNINLQNLPSTGSKFAKATKACFKSSKDWIFCGIDFSSLEDYISALTTKDPNKLNVYLDNYDGHSFRALAYFKKDILDIELSENNENCYKATVDNEEYYWKSSDTIVYEGKQYTGDEFYEVVK